jgi:hypothetical protein
MKRVTLLAILFILSCKNKESEVITEQPSKIDSIIEKSKNNFEAAALVSNKSDSATNKTIYKIIKEIGYLTNEVTNYKKINLMSKEVVSTEKIIYKIDTVYIETKKNFWGKEKVKTSVKSDSSVDMSIDTSVNEALKIDTLQQN